MADSRRYASNQVLGIEQILAEAQHRWLRPSEICEILRNYQRFRLAPEPPDKPPGGSLFLFDRKTIRYFRKDGHSWRKKKDGKTVREAHEKLKAGSVDVLHCYYAHGEDNVNFQRRCYWMLDEHLEHIVLVHYREVKEGSRPAISRVSNVGSLSDSHFGSGRSSSVQASSFVHTVPFSYASSPSTVDWHGASSPNTVDWHGQTPTSNCEEVESRGNSRTAHLGGYINQHVLEFRPPASLTFKTEPSEELENPLYVSQIVNGSQSLQVATSSGLSYNLPAQMVHTGSGAQVPGVTECQKVSYQHDENASGKPHNTEKSEFDLACRMVHAMPQQTIQRTSLTELDVKMPMNVKQLDYDTTAASTKDGIMDTQDCQPTSDVEGTCGSPMVTTSSDQYMTVGDASTANCLSAHSFEAKKQSDLNKVDSFGRWMNKEIGRDCDDSLMASGPDFLWGPLASGQKEGSGLSQQMQVDVDSLGYSLSQEQLFTILDFSPEWAYSGAKTKVLICGTFLGSLEQQPSQMKWCCMFGEVEVPAEVLPNNSIRCQAPMHLPGRVPFYITCSNRLACSEVREFEYREVSRGQSIGCMAEPEEEMRLQIRLAKMLHLCDEEKQNLGCSVKNCEKCYFKTQIRLCREGINRWDDIESSFSGDGEDRRKPREMLIQNLLKDRLCEWLVCKIHEEGRGLNILDDNGQGVIHLAAALGYEWAMNSIIAAGVPPAFRDAHGWTGLHWAAYYGREETVLVLIRLGASPGAVDDPTPTFPAGKTAADVASSRGHKGLAGYLAEADLTSHLSSMTMKPATMHGVSVSLSVDDAAKNVDDQKIVTDGAIKDQLSIRGSLAAIRNSAQAAARIQTALRVQSFIQRQSTQIGEGKCDLPDELLALSSLNKGSKIGHFSDSLHTAAARIQQKYRSWKGRKEFLNMRNRVVKIQAHVRGHQVRKHYKKVVWSVSIVEKAILRWRRKGSGLRGFRAKKIVADVGEDTGRTDDYDFLSAARRQKVTGIEKALARVKSMARSPEARDQYMRLIKKTEAINEGDASNTDWRGRDAL